MQKTHGNIPRAEKEKIIYKYQLLKHDKSQANGLTMTKENGALDT